MSPDPKSRSVREDAVAGASCEGEAGEEFIIARGDAPWARLGRIRRDNDVRAGRACEMPRRRAARLMFVLDASFAAASILRDETRESTDSILHRLDRETAFVP
jgi:hypothetical protein